MMSTYRKMKGKLTTTQKSPTKCQDFFCPYFLHTISLVTQEVYLCRSDLLIVIYYDNIIVLIPHLA